MGGVGRALAGLQEGVNFSLVGLGLRGKWYQRKKHRGDLLFLLWSFLKLWEQYLQENWGREEG